jgi:hypothetical protein
MNCGLSLDSDKICGSLPPSVVAFGGAGVGGGMAVKRIIVPAVLVAALLLGGAGCVQNRQQDKQRNINDDALVYMEQKYGEKFEYVSPWGSSYTGTHQLFVKCNSTSSEEILVEVEKTENGNIFRDNMLAVKYRQDTKDFLLECAEKIFGQAKILYEPTKECQSESLSATASFAEYLADTRATIMPTIVVKTSSLSSKDQADALAQLVAAGGVRFLISLSIVSDSDYEAGSWQSLGDFLAGKYKSTGATITNSNAQIEVDWTEED